MSQPILGTQTYVEQNDVWNLVDCRQSCAGRGSFGSHFDMWFSLDQHSNTSPYDGVVFDNADTNTSLFRTGHNGTSTLTNVFLSELKISDRAPSASARSTIDAGLNTPGGSPMTSFSTMSCRLLFT